MTRLEWLARIVLGFILIGVPTLILGYQYVLRPALSSTRVIDISARIPEAGGFSPDAVRVSVGETVTLRFSSSDVTHGIAIGPGLGIDLGHIDPGTVREVTVTFDHPDTYTFYCNTWCSPDHWRMRGIIEVRDPSNSDLIPVPQPDPVIAALQAEGVNIDAERSVYNPIVGMQPSASRGEGVITNLNIPAELGDEDWQRTHTPADALNLLIIINPESAILTLVDTVAYLWLAPDNSAPTMDVANLYAQNCAACHGQAGGGDGPIAELTTADPVAFSDPAYMFLMRGDVLYAKIRRGGMGTDMPNFGTLFTPEETWALVDYLWSLTLEPDTTQ
ncbi:MAG: c-type cytochrome [Anaerolineae bacterium]|nr:c-type cytochrome [Anaerolineae bacterium]